MRSGLPLILASASPRRSQLLREIGIPFEVITADVQELDAVSSPLLTPTELAQENARLKALAVAKLKPDRWILGADTVVALSQRLFGKPASVSQASEFLQTLSGETHAVITGCVLTAPDGIAEIFHDITHVTFLSLSPEIIARYLAHVHVLDKAGAYALQEHGDWIVDRVEGSHHNVIGLPTERIGALFKSRGLL